MSTPATPTPDGWWRNLAEARGAGIATGSDETEPPPAGIDRRRALKLMAAAAAMTTAACSRPREEIVPYVRMPERLVPGEPLFFATALSLGGYAQPVVVETHEGRPTKIEGNPQHPASGGATSAFDQAAILSLYDPGRSRVVLQGGQISNWDQLLTALAAARPGWRADGAGLRILSGSVTSPTLTSQIAATLSALPGSRWHRWQPINADAARRGAELAFGQRLEPRYRLDKARVILSLDDDFLGCGPAQVAQARAFSNNRRARAAGPALTRLYVAEPVLTLTGAQADRRMPLRRGDVAAFARALAAKLGAPPTFATPPSGAEPFLDSVAADLTAAGTAALVTVGAGQPASVHALGHWLNQRLGGFGEAVEMIAPLEADPVDHAGSIADLVADMRAGRVKALIVLGGNPAYDAPADLDFAAALKSVPLSLRFGLYDDETSELCGWHVPALHDLESWGDGAAADGTLGITQPLTTPLYGGRSTSELLAALTGSQANSAYGLVRDTWRARSPAADFEAWWRQTLHDGFVAASPPAAVAVGQAGLPDMASGPSAGGSAFEAVFLPDASVWDGSLAENAWLQELPQPLTKLTWGNAAHVAPRDAQQHGITDGQLLRVSVGDAAIDIPAVIVPGTAPGTIGLPLGYGRRTGTIARDVGADVYGLRQRLSPWNSAAAVAVLEGHVALASTQGQRTMAGQDLVRTVTRADLATPKPATPPQLASLLPARNPRSGTDPYAWAMVIDQSVCIGCNACVAACQAENNTPVVGPDEIRNSRDMHWLRVDLYYKGEPEAPAAAFQPVPCMHCEKAPCEPVCPVEASVHDSEGLNVQVYNRCIGTRFCQANCPYKVRRFNWFGYGDGQEYGNLGDPALQAVHNPDVSVRARGVMEKCTYCVQRVSRARRGAEKDDRSIAEGEVVTACQQACPTSAIAFGNLNDPASAVARLRGEPHHYALLGELGTKPRTTYLAQVRETLPASQEPAPE